MKKAKLLIKGLVFLLVYNAALFYIILNIHVFLKAVFGFEETVGIGIVIGFFAYAYFFGRFVYLSVPIKIVGSYWFVFFQYALLSFPILNLLVHFAHLPIFWAGMLFLIFIGCILSLGTFNAYASVVRQKEIIVPHSPYTQLRIAVASDMHFGTLSGVRHAKKMVRLINEEQVDLVLFPGDIVDDDPTPFIEKEMGSVLEGIQSRLGVFACLGNHDYYGKKTKELIEELQKRNIPMLLDESILVEEKILITGRKDHSDEKRIPMNELLQGKEKEYLSVCLDHQPHELNEAQQAGVDVLVCGHTHKGQMFPNNIGTRFVFELDYGYKLKESMHAFVSSGFGFWGAAIRIGSRSELLIIDVKKA